MKRTQLYLEENLWKLLQIQARQSGFSMSELVRQAVRDKYVTSGKSRKEVFRSVVGLWRRRKDIHDTETYLRSLRRGTRLKRISR